MAAENFPAALAIVLREEGGNVDDPHDRGGRTSRGVIQRVWDAYRKSHPGKPSDVWLASDEDVKAVYYQQYWLPSGDQLPAGLDLAFFDFAVNAGRTQAVRSLQRALGFSPPDVDGMFGMVTETAIRAADVPTLIAAYAEIRRNFYRALKQFPRYGKGWLLRTDRVTAAALSMVVIDPNPAPLPEQPEGSAKVESAEISAAEPAVSPEIGMATTATGAAGGGIVDTLNTTAGQLAPYQYSIGLIKYFLLAVALIGIGITIYGLWRRNKTKASIG